MYGNATCFHYVRPENNVSFGSCLPNSETGDFTKWPRSSHHDVLQWFSSGLSHRSLAQLSSWVLPACSLSTGHSTSAGRWSSRGHAGLIIPARGPYRVLCGAAAPLIMSWRAEFEGPQDPLGPSRGREAPFRGSRHPWGVEWPSLSCHSNPHSALCLEDDAIKDVLRQQKERNNVWYHLRATRGTGWRASRKIRQQRSLLDFQFWPSSFFSLYGEAASICQDRGSRQFL